MKRALSKKNLWEKLPPSLKTVAGYILGILPMPYLLGRGFRKTLFFVEDAQWWPSERAQQYQLSELRRVCTLAYERSAYYRKVFESIGFHPQDLKTIENIRGLPLIDRETLKRYVEKMCTVSPQSPEVDYITTAGTSGSPLSFYTSSRRSGIEYAYLISGWKRAGFLLGMKKVVLRGKVVSKDHHGLYQEYDPLLKQQYYSTFHMTEVEMRRYINHISGVGPCYLHAYPSSVAILAHFLRRNNNKPPQNILGILAESENVYPEQRSMVEDVFGCRYFSSYGHTEKLVAAAECERSRNYHVWPTYGFLELLDEHDRPVTTPGQRGEIVATGFINTIVPFIRYRTGDYATYVGDRCEECGREQPLIGDIRGHNIQECLVAIDNTLIPWSAVNMHDDTFNDVVKFQFYQDTPGRATLKIVPSDGFSDGNVQRISKNLGKKVDGRIEFRIQLVDSVPLTNRGKVIYVDQRIPDIKIER